MNDKEFDKIFGDKLREERSFNSQESDWEQLVPRLNAVGQTKEDNKRRAAGWLWLLLLPILSIFLWQMNALKNQNNQLATQLTDVQSQLATLKEQRNTFAPKVSKTDTIILYKNAVRSNLGIAKQAKNPFPNKNLEKMPPSVSNDFLSQNFPISNKNTSFTKQKNIVLSDTTKPNLQNADSKMAELIVKLADMDKQIADLKQALSEQKIGAATLVDCATKQDSLKQQLAQALAFADSLKIKPLSIEPQKTDKTLKNNRLFIGFQGGQINYKTNWINAVGINVYRNIKSYQGGLKLEYALTDKLRATASGDFCPFSFLIYWQDGRYNLPALEFDPQKEKYLKAESKQNLLQGNLGLKYFFTEGVSSWRPFVSAAYTMMRIQPFETKYTYQSLWGQTNREQIVQSKSVNVNKLLLLSGGLEYRFSKFGVAQAEAFYYKDAHKTPQTFDLFGFRAAVLLNLK